MKTVLLLAVTLLAVAPTVYAQHAAPVRVALPPSPTPAIVRVVFTTVDLPARLTTVPDAAPAMPGAGRDDLAALRAAASKDNLPLREDPGPAFVTPDGIAADLRAEHEVPVEPSSGLRVREKVGACTRVTPKVQADGTITLSAGTAETFVAGPAWRELGGYTVARDCAKATRAFRSGETLCLYTVATGPGVRTAFFATVTVLPPARG